MSTLAEDRDEILQLLYRYSHEMDSHDVVAWVGLFTDDGVFDAGNGRVATGPERLAKFAASAAGTTMRHIVGNPVIDVTGDTAQAEVYLTLLREGSIALTGTYHDELVRTPKGWRFAKRTFTPDTSPS